MDGNIDDDLPDPDEGLVLFPEDDGPDYSSSAAAGSGSANTSANANASARGSPDVSKPKRGLSKTNPGEPEHILGTIVARVVAARGLRNPYKNGSDGGGGGGGFFRGSLSSSSSSSSAQGTNPYASIKFGKTTQRTSGLYSTTDPIWPRDEVFFMDVALPASKLTHADVDRNTDRNTNTDDDTDDDSDTDHAPREGNDSLLEDPFARYQPPDNTTLTVAIFHSEPSSASGQGGKKKLCSSDGTVSGDSDDVFLGVASIDLTEMLTGKVDDLDEWIPLHGTASDAGAGAFASASNDNYNYNYNNNNSNNRRSSSFDHRRSMRKNGGGTGIGRERAAVRVVCEYEPSCPGPNPGDTCGFTRFCHPRDLYPLEPARSYQVRAVLDHGCVVVLRHSSPEGWVQSVRVHKRALVLLERKVSALELAGEELRSVGERLAASPLAEAVAETASRIAEDGLVGVAGGLLRGGALLADRWFLRGGFNLETVLGDLRDVTNLDGRRNREAPGQTLDIDADESDVESDDNDGVLGIDDDENEYDEYDDDEEETGRALPNMPPCPITGEPMIHPVVAADGHTYERRAIARWLKESDKSPLTGSVLAHTQLVPNYGLLSSIEEAAARLENESSAKAKANAKAKDSASNSNSNSNSNSVASSADPVDERKPPPTPNANA